MLRTWASCPLPSHRPKGSWILVHLLEACSLLIANHCLDLLHRAGWSDSEASFLGNSGQVWLVSGTNGEEVIEAQGRSSAEAWLRAVQQARALGMLRRRALRDLRRPKLSWGLRRMTPAAAAN